MTETKSFNEAFNEARKNKQLEFEWNGKKYTTQLANESSEQGLNEMYHSKSFLTDADRGHNGTIEHRLNMLNTFTPTDESGFSPDKISYLQAINRNLSPENRLSIADFDRGDPYGIKTSNGLTFGSSPRYKQDLSMLNTNQIHDGVVTATNTQNKNNPHQLTMDRIAQGDPDGSKSKALIQGETPEGLHNLYGKDGLHYNLASMLNDGLKTQDPEFSKLFQHNPSSFSSYDPDGSIAANYLIYGQTPPDDGSAMGDQARIAELNRGEQHFNDAQNHPIRSEFRTPIPEEYQGTNEDGADISRAILENSYKDQGNNGQYYVNQDPLAKKGQLLTQMNPAEIKSQEFKDGVNLSTIVPMATLGALYGGGALLRGFSKLDRFATRNLLKGGSNYLNYAKTPRLVNTVSRYGLLNGTIDSGFLGKSIYDYATNPETSGKEVAGNAAPFALMASPVRKGLLGIGNGIVKGFQNPYVKRAVGTGAGVGAGVGLNHGYQNVYKPASTSMFNNVYNSGPSYNFIQPGFVPKIGISKTTPGIFNSEIESTE